MFFGFVYLRAIWGVSNCSLLFIEYLENSNLPVYFDWYSFPVDLMHDDLNEPLKWHPFCPHCRETQWISSKKSFSEVMAAIIKTLASSDNDGEV